METVVGIFEARDQVDRAVGNLRSAGLPEEQLIVLMPGDSAERIEGVSTADTEPPGAGKAIGSVVGGALGAASGFGLGAAAATFFVPGVGPVIAAGVLAAALLGVGGAVGGAALGGSLDDALLEGLPKDELFVYEDALRRGRSIVIALVHERTEADSVRMILAQTGAEDVDAARDDWWVGLRDAEEEQYTAAGRDFRADEPNYRRGFEAAMHPQARGRSYHEAVNHLMARYPNVYREEAFRMGYERGRAHCKTLIKSFEKSA